MHGIGIKIHNSIGNWLHTRKQRVVNGAKYEWSPVMSGVPQGSVLGPALSIIYINDIDVNVSSLVHKFVADTTLHSNVCTCDQTDHLQCDLYDMSDWSTKWQISLNSNKRECLHVGHCYPSANNSIGGVEINNVKAEKDLGATIGCTLDYRFQCVKVVSTANKVISVISRTYVYMSQNNIMYLYKSQEKTHIEYCCQALCSQLEKAINNIKKVHRTATRMTPDISLEMHALDITF